MRASLVSQGDDVRARARGWAAGLLALDWAGASGAGPATGKGKVGREL